MKIHLDFETYSECDIKTAGAWAYAAHSSTEVLCMAMVNEYDSEPSLYTDPKKIANYLGSLFSLAENEFHSWNSFFEMAICAKVLKQYQPNVSDANWKKIVLNSAIWHDTAALAAAQSLPRALGDCGQVLGLPQDKQKDKRGKYLIQRCCKPYRGQRIQDVELLQELYEYCKQDVIAEREIANQLRPLSESERKVWMLDQTINARGVHVDKASVIDAMVIIEKATERLNGEVEEITQGELANVSQIAKTTQYIKDNFDYSLDNFQKETLKKVLQDKALHPTARRLIEIRQQTGKTSNAKYNALLKLLDCDNRARGLLMYHGASTGRWSGRLFQPQNLARSSFSDTDTCISLFHERCVDTLEMFYDDPLEALSSCIRGMLWSPQGKRLIVSDYSQIEARVLPWLAGQKETLKAFEAGIDIYKHSASQIYSKPIGNISKEERFIGKVATLALGYQGGMNAFKSMAANYGQDISEELAEKIKNDWRMANPKIVKFWYACENAAFEAVRTPGDVAKVKNAKNIAFRVVDKFLYCRLPSGRLLAYFKPHLVTGKFDKEQVAFYATNSYTRKWERQTTYGGKLVENITQAVARDVMAHAMLNVEKAGYEIVLSVHDELIAEASNDFGSHQEFSSIMCQLPEWAKGLPVEAEGYESERYRK